MPATGPAPDATLAQILAASAERAKADASGTNDTLASASANVGGTTANSSLTAALAGNTALGQSGPLDLGPANEELTLDGKSEGAFGRAANVLAGAETDSSWSAALEGSLQRIASQLAPADSTPGSAGVSGAGLLHSAALIAPDAALSSQGAPGNTAASVTTAPALPGSIAAQVGSDQFASETAAKILYFAQNNIQSAQLSLNPAHLGPMDVQIRVSGDQVNLALSAGQADTRHALEAGLPKLREMFSEQGIQLGDVSVGARAFSQGSGSQYSANSGHSGQSSQSGSGDSADAGSALAPVGPVSVRSLQLVDTFA